MPDPQARARDRALLEGLRRGEDEAFRSLVDANTAPMLAVARRFLRNEDDARDAVQDAYLSAFRSIDRFAGDALLSTWLHRIVVNACLMRLRSRRRRPETSIEDLLPGFLENGRLAVHHGAKRDRADRVLESRQLRSLVNESIDQLPEIYRTVLILRDIEGFDTEQTAGVLELSVP
ncbi:sigma-70 family RNA polymerase sigma factor, partial [Myxococcota bacterium]|nr:sigma-70 family RNA polymerase sigma factor [Myxococcota bacterium]